MSDPGGGPGPGWYRDPRGRHEHRYWDGTAWTDQVADEGCTATEPSGTAAGTVDPAPSAPKPVVAATPGARRLPVGLLAVLGVAVSAGVAAGALVLSSGDDGDRQDTRPITDASTGTDADGAGTFDGTVTEDEPVGVHSVELDAGDALRVVIVPTGEADFVGNVDLDPAVGLAVDEAALTDGFRGLLAPNGDQDQIDERVLRQTVIVAQEVLDIDAVDEVVTTYQSGDTGDDFLAEVVAEIAAVSPESGEVGPLFLGTDRGSGDSPEGVQFVAPAAGRYSVVVTGYGRSYGDYEATLEVESGDDSALDSDSIDYLDYLATYGDHVDFFCDADFFGADPDEMTNYGPTICNPDELSGTLSGQFNGDFTNDFGGGGG